MSRARDLANGTFSGAFSADSPTLVVDDANNRVGVGTASPSSLLDVDKSQDAETNIELTNTNAGSSAQVRTKYTTDGGLFTVGKTSDAHPYGGDAYIYNVDNTNIRFATNDTERARLTNDGNLLVGKTAVNTAGNGGELRANGQLLAIATDINPFFAARLNSDGDLFVFRKDTTTVGSISVLSGNLYITSPSATNPFGVMFVKGSDPRFIPVNTSGAVFDNAVDLGYSNSRWDDIWATNGTIQTSDANEKQDVAELDEAEKRVATAAKGLIRKFRWISSVEEKGDDARIHVGVIAQDLKAAFEAEGLDPGRYAMFTSNTWWEADEVVPAVEEVLDEEGNVITEAQPERTEKRTYDTAEEAPAGAVERTRLGVRYNQLLAFIIGAM